MVDRRIAALPFVSATEQNISSYWNPSRSDNYERDCETGRSYAQSLIGFVRETGFLPVLPWIAQALPKREEFGGVEVGFMSGIAAGLV